nr:hypothetical protein [Streptomyces sp. PR69]
MPFDIAEQRTGAEQQDADAVDLGERPVQRCFEPPRVRPVGGVRLNVQREQQIEVGPARGLCPTASVQVASSAARCGDRRRLAAVG